MGIITPAVAKARAGSIASLWEADRSRKIAEEAVRDLVEQQTTAWNTGKVDALVAHLSRDATATDMDGTVLEGSQAVAQQRAHLLSTIFRGSHLTQNIRSIRLVTRDVAIVLVDTEISGFSGLPAGVKAWPDGILRTHLLEVIVDTPSGWSIEAVHDVDAKIPTFQS